ncbi:hypothetical protein NEOLEDRAFT_1136685 [Neolentinus lepideus HHB14362 ss-1]|uniref:Uncharacterized protein n=1 Tax=Neolentinus lepideus HHB14362 ss-1 TaxID=1314782 RepID=A0A165R5H4_9AGAM|nr:hypothetical protein NEOLEDRAFT_1136685 [Neolentinus lepideus HHB14362 ss-1]
MKGAVDGLLGLTELELYYVDELRLMLLPLKQTLATSLHLIIIPREEISSLPLRDETDLESSRNRAFAIHNAGDDGHDMIKQRSTPCRRLPDVRILQFCVRDACARPHLSPVLSIIRFPAREQGKNGASIQFYECKWTSKTNTKKRGFIGNLKRSIRSYPNGMEMLEVKVNWDTTTRRK